MRPVSRLGLRGVAAVEFAICAPVLILLALGTTDVVTMLRAQLRIETAAVQLGQIVSQCVRINTKDRDNFFAHAQLMVGSLGRVTGNVDPEGAVVITAVKSVADTTAPSGRANRVAWQVRDGGTTGLYSSTAASGPSNSAAPVDTAASIAANLVVPVNETLIVTEVFLERQALVLYGGFVANFVPPVLRANTLFLSRAPDALAIQTPPITSSTADCTA
jgi:Flp pilus assembly protein TadG